MPPTFDELPFNVRPDLSPYLIHLTKRSTSGRPRSAFENLIRILKVGEIRGSSPQRGLIKGGNSAACFMDVPLASMKYVLTPENRDPQMPRYEPYGIAVTKKYAYANGCRPVLYLSDEETESLRIPREELWRVVRFEVSRRGWISWLHEREWRCKGNFDVSNDPVVFVRHPRDAQRLAEELNDDRDAFQCIPRAILPLNIICQGYLEDKRRRR